MTLHRNMQIIGGISVSTLGAAAIATFTGLMSKTHGNIGLVIYACVFFQLGLGMVSLWGRENTLSVKHGITKYTKYFHRIFGTLLLLLSWTNIYLGIRAYAPEKESLLTTLYFVWLGIIVISFGVGQYWYKYGSTLQKQSSKADHRKSMTTFLVDKKVENLPFFTIEEINERVAQGACLVMMDGYVFDIRKWIQHHPGGVKILEAVVGTDIGDDFYGRHKLDELEEGDKKDTRLRKKKTIFNSIIGDYMTDNYKKKGLGDYVSQLFPASISIVKHNHSRFAAEKLASMLVGRLIDERDSIGRTDTQTKRRGQFLGSTLNPKPTQQLQNHLYRRYVVNRITVVTLPASKATVKRFDISILHPIKSMEPFQPGEYVEIQARYENQIIVRAITPIQGTLSKSFYFYAKLYPDGLMSKFLDDLQPGAQVKVRGPLYNVTTDTILNPIERFSTTHRSALSTASSETVANSTQLYEIPRPLRNATRPEFGCWDTLYMVAGGSGITPMLQLIYYHLENGKKEGSKNNHMHLLYSSSSIFDVIDGYTLDHLIKKAKGRLTITHVLSTPCENWNGLTGHIDHHILRKWICTYPGNNDSPLQLDASLENKDLMTPRTPETPGHEFEDTISLPQTVAILDSEKREPEPDITVTSEQVKNSEHITKFLDEAIPEFVPKSSLRHSKTKPKRSTQISPNGQLVGDSDFQTSSPVTATAYPSIPSASGSLSTIDLPQDQGSPWWHSDEPRPHTNI
ncbi:hypothetical protein K7432_015928, partial [Basidiobolus ranarum]